MNATDQIEQYVKEQRQGRLLDVAKYVLPAMIASGDYEDETYEELAEVAVSFAEALIKEVESR